MEQARPSMFGKQLKLVAAIGALLLLLWFVVVVREVLYPFALAFVLAYVLAPLVDRMEGRGINRTLSILMVFVAVFGVLIIGAFKAGTKLTAEMLELSEQFLVQESVDRELTLTNLGAETVEINAAWQGVDPDQPAFAVREGPYPLLTLQPGEQQALRLRFEPANARPDSAVLSFLVPTSESLFELRVRGNRPAAGREAGSSFWDEEVRSRASEAHGIVFSSQGLDFGRAGPNIFTRLSEEADKIQLWFEEKYGVGAEFDLGRLVKEQGGALARTLLGGTTEILGGVFSGITFLVIVPFVAFFLLREGHNIRRGLVELVPNAYFELCLNLLHQIDGQIGGYIRGLILATSVVGTLSVLGLTLIGVPYALPVGLVAGLANMIPFLGPLIGIVAASIVALATGGGFGMVGHVLIVFLAIQMIDNVLIQPIVLAKSVDLHPLVVLSVVLIGGQLMGLVGMLVAVPLTGILKVGGYTVFQGIRGYRPQ